MLSDYQDMLQKAVDRKVTYRTTHVTRQTKGDVLDFYKSEYGKQGTRQAAEALYKLGIVKNRSGEPVKVESLMRRFQSRGGRSQGETRDVYAALGKDLPLKEVRYKIIPNQFTISVKGEQGTGVQGETRARSWAVTFSGETARAFAESPTYESFFDALGYPEDVIDRFEDGDYELEVTSVA